MFGEPLQELDGTARKLWQVLNDMEVERIVGVDAHSGQRLIVIKRLFKVFQQRLVVIALFFAL